MRIIVTGGAGFIGSHIVDGYLAAGHEVAVVDNFWSHGGGRRENVDSRVRLVEADIRDASLEKLFADFKPEIVSHHAAQHSVAISSRDPQFDAQINVLGLLNVLEQSVKSGVKKVLFASSGATFGEPERLPITEATPQRPESPYAITKMVSEHYLRFYRSEHGLDFTALRYGNVYGPRQDPNGEAGVISIFIGRFLARQGPKSVLGRRTDARLHLTSATWSRRTLRALERGSGMCYVIGTGKKTSVNEIYRALVEVTGFEAPIEYLPRRPGDVRDAQFDSSLAKRELEWTAAMPLLGGMRATYELFQRETTRINEFNYVESVRDSASRITSTHGSRAKPDRILMPANFIDLTGRVSVVTGGSRGIGAAAGLELARAGSAVALFDLDGDEASHTAAGIERETGCKARGYTVDVRKPEVLKQMCDAVAQDFGSLDHLINNAGVQYIAPLSEFPDDKWDLRHEHQPRRRLLCNEGRLAAHGRARDAVVSSTMASVQGLIASLVQVRLRGRKARRRRTNESDRARRYVAFGITVNAICPGAVMTDLVRNQAAGLVVQYGGGMSEEEALSRAFLEQMPSKRFIDPQEVGQLATYLCSDAARSITGAPILIDGGWAAH